MKKNALILFAWLAVILIAVAIITQKLNVAFDLGVLLPRANSKAEAVLVERVGQSPGARWLFLAIDKPEALDIDALRAELGSSEHFRRVLGGRGAHGLEDIPEIIFRYRYILDDRTIDEAFLVKQFADRAREFRLLGSPSYTQVAGRDPSMAAIEVMQRSTEFAFDDDDSQDRASVLVFETAAPAFDIGAQRLAIRALEEAIARASPGEQVAYRLTGIGYIGTQIESQIRTEATWRSAIAGLVLVMILYLAYRRIYKVVLGAIPLASGALVALATVALFSDSVHGITLAFGFTLLGIGVDYPVHLFSHARRQSLQLAVHAIWPTLKLGLLSTLVAYVAFTFTGSEGTRQLGIFTAVGLVAIAIVTRYVLPVADYLVSRANIESVPRVGQSGDTSAPRLRWHVISAVLIASIVVMYTFSGNKYFDDNLANLSPVPKSLLQTDHEIRGAAGSPDSRYLIALRHARLDDVLRATERVEALLSAAAPETLSRWFAVTRLIPSEEVQERRRQSLPDDTTLSLLVENASEKVGFDSARFGQFKADVAEARARKTVVPTDYAGTVFETLIGSHLYQSDDTWVSIIALNGLTGVDALRQQLAQSDGTLVDLKETSAGMVRAYRGTVAKILAIAALLIVLLLVLSTTIARGLWTITSALTAVTGAAAYTFLVSGPLNLYHLIALLLVAGLVLDYALFLSRPELNAEAARDTGHAVLTCVASTAATFSILAFSKIPALNSLGTVVATGVTLGAFITWTSTRGLSRESPTKVSE